MSNIVDDEGNTLFADTFDHSTHDANGVTIDVISTGGNLWLVGSDVLDAMGFTQHKSGGHSRRLKRTSHPDIIKIADTPFRFTDGRRNRGSFISPRAVMKYAEGKTQGYNPFKALPFIEWMNERLLTDGRDADGWSPAKEKPITLEPVFREVITAKDENEAGEPLDPLRPKGVYPMATVGDPIKHDEVEFCMCPEPWEGLGKCWCGGKGRIRSAIPVPYVPYNGDEVLDDEDDFSPFTAWSHRAGLDGHCRL